MILMDLVGMNDLVQTDNCGIASYFSLCSQSEGKVLDVGNP